MLLKSLKNTKVNNKTVLYRSPYDIGTKEKNGKFIIKDNIRIQATLPTLKYLLKKNCKIAILTYVKRPDGKVVEGLRTTPHAKALSKLLGKKVLKADDCVGESVKKQVKNLKAGEILMLENTRFHPEETIDDDKFAKKLAENGEVVIFDGFPQAHRIHASTTGILRHLPSCAGLYLEKEVKALTSLITKPKKPFTVVIGGIKISDKVEAINNFIKLVDHIIVGGGVANVFLKAQEKQMGDSFIEDVFVDTVKREKKDLVVTAKEIILKAKGKIIMPSDLVLGDDLENPERTKKCPVTKAKSLVPHGWAALDIGERSQLEFVKIIAKSKTIFWNGPMGKYEDKRFSAGTKAVCTAIEKNKGKTVIAGGDTIEAARLYSDLDRYSFVSLAGGASFELLAEKPLPALEMLKV